MEVISKDILKSIDRSKNEKSLKQLNSEFRNTYNKIQEFKDDPSCEQYHNLYDQLIDLDHRILTHPERG